MATQQELELILEGLERADSLDEMQGASEALRDWFAINHLIYHSVSANGGEFGCGTYSREWQKRYTSNDYARIDPVVIGCFQRFHPVDWKRLDWSSKAARALLAEAIAHGLGNQGFSIPIRGPNGQFALFTANHECDDDTWQAFTERHRRTLILTAHYFNKKALEFSRTEDPPPPASLSPREVDAMTLLAIGYSRAQVAQTLSISQHTLRVYVESARFKLGAMNTTHAVARALTRGLIVI
jgi:DNA-binding CsgD family transcriptional regulator